MNLESTKNDCYDEIIHISAGELRKMGIEIPIEIPDCGYIPRTAFEMKLDPEHKITTTENGTMTCPMIVRFNEPFKWIKVSVMATKKD